MNIVAISGSLRNGSYNTMLLKALAELAPEGMQIDISDISSLPIYNQDDEANFPASAQTLKDKIEKADSIIISTPEYNRSIPGVLKNAIDWASRPWGKNSFAGKPTLIMGVSVGKTGTAIAQSHLRQIMAYLDADTICQPELYFTSEIFSAEGGSASGGNGEENIVDASTKELLTKALVVLGEAR